MANSTLSPIWAAGLGAGLMLVLDPVRGRRRRALVRDKLVHAMHKSADAMGATSRDVRHRAVGLAAATRSRLETDAADDDRIVARVRAAIGRAVSHPGAIVVSSREGHVALAGPVLAHEVGNLIATARKVRGVRSVENRLDVHTRADDVPALQGGVERHPQRFALAQENWPPSARLMAGAAGLGLLLWGMRQRSWLGAATVGAGTGLFVRGLTNLESQRLLGLSGRRGIDIQKTIHIARPIAEVFAAWRHYEHFPHFMRHVRAVRDIGGGRSRWTVDGPGGVPVHWEAEITREIPDQLIAWKTAAGSPIRHAGVVRFDPTPQGETRVTLRLSYNPPAGALAHSLAWLLGADPRQRLDEDMVRMKRFIETGIPPRDAAQPAPHEQPAQPTVSE